MSVNQAAVPVLAQLALALALCLGACKSKAPSEEASGQAAKAEEASTASSVVTADLKIDKPVGEPKKVDMKVFAPDEYVKELIHSYAIDDYYGIYMANRKAGYGRMEARKTKPSEPGGFVVSLEAQLKADGELLRFGGAAFYEVTPPYQVVAIEKFEGGGSGSVSRTFTRSGDKTLVHSTIDGKVVPDSTAPAMCGSLTAAFGEVAPKLEDLEEGMVVEYCSFDADTQKREQSMLRVRELREQRINGVPVQVAGLESKDANETLWTAVHLTGSGTTLQVNMSGLLVKLEDKAVAMSDVVGIDVLATSVKVNKKLGEPSDIKELKMVVALAKGFVLPSTPNQESSKRPDGRYDIRIRSIAGAAVGKEEREEALQATPEADAHDASIVALAESVAGKEGSVRQKVTALNHWVYENLEKSLSTNLSTASQVLEHKTGDCTEHSILLVALLRSQKIPARQVGGVTYMGPELSAFGWHAWVEAEIDGHWVQVDPSWDEPVSNASHLRLGAGDDDESTSNLGTLSIEIL